MAEITNKPLLSLVEITHDFRSERLLSALSAGVVTGILAVIMSVSMGALIFSGPFSVFVPLGMGLFLLGSAMMGAIVALFSAHASLQLNLQDAPAAILTTAIAAALTTMPATLSGEAQYYTIVVNIVLATVLTGLVFILFGRYQLGSLVRFLPYPVVGGFLAGTGWLLLMGATRVMTQSALSWNLFQPAMLLRWLPGLGFAFTLRGLLRRSSHPLIVPGLFLSSIGLFYLVAFLLGKSPAEVSAEGWLLGPFPQGSGWQFPLTPAHLSLVHWPAITANLLILVPVFVIAVLSFLLNISGLELMVKQDLDLNREMKLVGLVNVAGGLFGSIIGFYSLSLSGLNHQLARGSRLTSLVAAAFVLIIFLVGTSVLSYVPRMVLGGMLMYLGISFLIRWVVEARQRFSPFEYGVIWLILAVIALVGFLQGVGVGLVATVILFVINYSQINVVKHTLTGQTYQSRVTRGREPRHFLDEQGEQIHILQLQGFIFFGTAHRLVEQVRERILDRTLPPLRFLVLDFRQVTGVDSTALLSFAKLKQLADEQRITLVLTQVAGNLTNNFSHINQSEKGRSLQFFPDLDRGVAWCEETILQNHNIKEEEQVLTEQLAPILLDAAKAGVLVSYLERQEVEPGFYLIRQGDAPDGIYFVEHGLVTAQLERQGAEPVRLETMHGGRVVGEIGFYLGAQRTAAVRADKPTTIYRLSLAQLAEMEKSDPVAAARFHRVIAHLLAERAAHLIRAVDALLQ